MAHFYIRAGDWVRDPAGEPHQVLAALPSKLLVADRQGRRWVISRLRIDADRTWRLEAKRAD